MDLEWKVRKRYSPKNGIQRKVGVAVLISDEIDFEIKIVMTNKKRTLHNDKEDHTSRRHNTYLYLCFQSGSTNICKVTQQT